MVLLLKQLFISSCVAYSIQFKEWSVYKLDSTLQNSSEDQLLTVLLYGSEKFALNSNKEIISYLKASERFVQPFLINKICIYLFLFFLCICSFVILLCHCTGLTVSDYILLEFCVLFRPQF